MSITDVDKIESRCCLAERIWVFKAKSRKNFIRDLYLPYMCVISNVLINNELEEKPLSCCIPDTTAQSVNIDGQQCQLFSINPTNIQAILFITVI